MDKIMFKLFQGVLILPHKSFNLNLSLSKIHIKTEVVFDSDPK